MRKFAKGEDEAEVNMTPMLDIVFIMLIFFIVTATFVRESGIEVNKPEDNNQQDQTPPDEEKRPIAFVIDDGNRITHEFRTVDISAVQSIIKRESVERPAANVIIQAATGAHMENVISIYDDALAVGMPPEQVIVVSKKK